MKKVLLLCVAMSLAASTAFAAAGADLSFGACPNNAGATGGTSVPDGFTPITMLISWSPVEAIPDVLAIDGLIDLNVPTLATATYWQIDAGTGCNFVGLSSANLRPAAGCSTPNVYVNCWQPAGSGSGTTAIQRSPTVERIAFTCFRPSFLSVAAGARLFGAQIIFNAFGDATDRACDGGAADPVGMVLNSVKPSGGGAVTPSELTTSTGNDPNVTNCAGFNSGSGLCGAVPTRNRTWGQLKSLYR